MARTWGFRLPRLAIVAVAAMVLGLLVEVPPLVRHASAVAPVSNPTIADSCGVDTTLVLDASGSINSSHAVENVRNAAQAFLDALEDTRSTARVTQFGSVSAQLAPSTLVDSTSLGANGVLTNALKGYYNPIPPAPPGVALHQYRGSGDPASASSWQNGSSNQYTNWDQSLKQAAAVTSELVVYVTDGDPTAYDFRGTGDPFKAGDVGYNTDKSSAAQVTIDRAIEAANTVKTAGTRMLAVGVGNALGSSTSQQRLQSISGPQIVRDADLATITSLNQVDVALVTDFADLADFLRSVVLQLCSPSLTIRKLAQSADDSSYRPAPGWAITAAPTTTNGQFTWILPDTVPAVSKTSTTDQDGFAQFQWEPVPSQQDSSAVISEAVQPGFTPGRPPPDTDFTCTLRNDAGDVRVVQGELTVNGTTASFTLPQIGQEIVTCTLFNSFDYDPAIGITKVNAPTAVRGDITPPATVTSAYQVTNEGNTPLSDVYVTDDHCAPVLGVLSAGANVGDTNLDDLLDLTEVWQFSCTRPAVVSRGAAAPAPAQKIVNVATATGTDPTGTTVDAAATDDVDVYFPAIALTKLVDDPTTPDPPADSVTIALGAAVDYTYAVTNTGNTALGTVVLDDDTAPCDDPTPDPANTAAPLLPGQTWNYSCTDVAPPGDVVNTAEVTAIPLNPDTGTPFAGNNPLVTATDFAEVDVVNPNIELLKSVDPDVVLLAPGGAPESVTYTFEATNTGTPALNRPGATSPGAAKDPGWIQDPHCAAPATYVDNGGDANANDLLDPDETWTFTCPGSVAALTLNIATITAQPSDAAGVPLPGVGTVADLALALVQVVQPAITIDKTALRGVVLDGGASPVAGPDAPTPRPALYRYEVTNTGNVAPLAVEPPTDDICATVDFVDGDTNDDALLDVDETFVYTCSTALDRDQNNVGPPPGNLSGVVRNTASVTGVPFFEGALVPDKSVEATDTATVQVIEPGLSITKTASAPVVLPGTAVTYTYAVTNTGDVGLTLIGPEDDQCAPLVFTGGDRPPFNGILEGADSGGGETFTYTCTRVLDEPPLLQTSHVNTVVVGGVDPLGNFYVDSDTAEVRVFEPAISLTKTVSDDLVLTGSTVTYDFHVTNTGTSPIPTDDVLAGVTLMDASSPATPTCDSPAFVGGDTSGDGLLQRDPPEIWTYRCATPITAPTTDVAVVEATGGTQFQLPITVTDADAAFVQPFSPAITVTKTAAPTALLGSGPVTYTYTVRNTGDVPLADIASRITDDRCATPTYVSGDEDGDGLLDTINSIFEDALDETWIFTCTTTISATTTNTVVVTGTPTDPVGLHLCGEVAVTAAAAARLEADTAPCDVSASAQATVQVVDPATIVITKRTTTPTAQTFGFDLAGQTFELGDGASHTATGVAPGSYIVTESSTVGWTLVDISCTDASGDSVVTIGQRQVTIVVSPGETVSCDFTNRPAGTLPSTGATDLVTALLTGAALVGLGAVLVIARRRRRTASA